MVLGQDHTSATAGIIYGNTLFIPAIPADSGIPVGVCVRVGGWITPKHLEITGLSGIPARLLACSGQAGRLTGTSDTWGYILERDVQLKLGGTIWTYISRHRAPGRAQVLKLQNAGVATTS